MAQPSNQPPNWFPEDNFRWQVLFQRCTEALFLLNRQRRIRFVNQTWEALTAMSAAEAQRLVCKRHRDAVPGSPEALANALSPPPEALEGKPGRVRRRLTGVGTGPQWWDIEFFPLRDREGFLGLLGKITPVSSGPQSGPVALPEKLVHLREDRSQKYRFDQFASDLPVMRRVVEQARLASQVRLPLLLAGEKGTGKKWLARTIHYQGPTREQTFVALDGAHLPADVLTEVLFGARGLLRNIGAGTVYLQEPSCLPRDLQARLCELLQSSSDAAGEQVPRLIVGCSSSPEEDIRAGRLLDELYCACSTLTISVPPLRQRKADLPWLIEPLLSRAAQAAPTAQRVTGLTPGAWELIRAHEWPGNLQELYTVLLGACRRAKSSQLEPADLPAYLTLRLEPDALPRAERPLPLDQLLEEVERRLIQVALRMTRDNKTRAAELLSIWRPRLLRRMEKLGIADAEAARED
jgi:transcriptional regulator with PAS, ATPase and Fis domain